MDERAEIEAAAGRLLDGTPLRSDGKLTIVSLAAEAGVKWQCHPGDGAAVRAGAPHLVGGHLYSVGVVKRSNTVVVARHRGTDLLRRGAELFRTAPV